jgi:hypothetical protein
MIISRSRAAAVARTEEASAGSGVEFIVANLTAARRSSEQRSVNSKNPVGVAKIEIGEWPPRAVQLERERLTNLTQHLECAAEQPGFGQCGLKGRVQRAHPPFLFDDYHP